MSKEELIDIIQDVVVASDGKHVIEEIAIKVAELIQEAYNKGFKDGAGELPF